MKRVYNLRGKRTLGEVIPDFAEIVDSHPVSFETAGQATVAIDRALAAAGLRGEGGFDGEPEAGVARITLSRRKDGRLVPVALIPPGHDEACEMISEAGILVISSGSRPN